MRKLKNFKVTKVQKNLSEMMKEKPSRKHYKKLITDSCLIKTEKGYEMLYLTGEDQDKKILQAYQRLVFTKGERISGLKSSSITIGSRPRSPRYNYCATAASASKYPNEHEVFLQFSKELAKIYKHFFPKVYQYHMSLLNNSERSVFEWYIIAGTPFTSGIINKNSELGYHTDRGNYPNTFSCMHVMKKDVSGGYLVLPEYEIAFELSNNSILIFNGQEIIHGVTPITKASPEAYRYSTVFYAMKEMWRCLPFKEELERIRKINDNSSHESKDKN